MSTMSTSSTSFCCLEKVSALDLVAVLGTGELLHVLGVLAGDHEAGHVGIGGVNTRISSKTTDITGNSFQTFL